MSSSAKKDKQKGLVGTILFHALLIVAFLFMGLTYQIPPPPEEGISINFGYMDEGMSETEPRIKQKFLSLCKRKLWKNKAQQKRK